jgi:hypothetical protein
MLTPSQIKTLENAEKRIKNLLSEIEQCKKGTLKFEVLADRISKMHSSY